MLKIVLLRRFNHSLPILPPKNAREYPRTDVHRVAYGLTPKTVIGPQIEIPDFFVVTLTVDSVVNPTV